MVGVEIVSKCEVCQVPVANVKPIGDHCDRAKGDHLGEKEKSAVVGRGKGSGEGGCIVGISGIASQERTPTAATAE